jgi:hypothetical protein
MARKEQQQRFVSGAKKLRQQEIAKVREISELKGRLEKLESKTETHS